MMATSSMVHALGMGEIEVSTALNEPLDAKIKLFSATSDELNSLQVSLASRDAFEHVGIDRLPILRELKFELVGSGAGAPYIKINSAKAIKEPFLDFILTINWPSGQMMREYTLLLDPPVFEKEQQVGRISAATTQPAQVVRQQPAAIASQARVAPAGSYGPTNRKDTLWGVARDMRPDRSVSVPQMMIGLLKENPEAFGDNNINNLRAGHILRAPEMEVITALSKQQAAAEANRQFQEWQASRGKGSAVGRQQRVVAPTPASSESMAGAPAAAPVATQKASDQARLQLLTPEEEARVRSGVGSGASGDAVESLQRQLAVALESSEAGRQENSDLRLRLEELEKQLQSVQKLLTLKDDTLGALQADTQLKQQVEAAAATLEAAKPEADAAAPAAPKQPAKPVVQPEPVPVSLVDEILGNPMYMAAGGGVIVLLLLAALIMRRRSQADNEEDFSEMAPVGAVADNKPATAAEGAVAAQPVAEVASAATSEADDDVSIGDFGGGMGAIHTEESEIDPVAEADVYLAYRRYEQAEALLKEAINVDADRHELKVKLLEIYYATKDIDSFEAQAESLYAVLAGQDEAMWNQVVEMGRELLPDHPLFADGSVAETGLTQSDLGFEPSGADEEFNFDDAQPVSEADTEISDDDLAESLGLSGLADASDKSGELEGLDVADVTADTDEISLDDLGDLDLDLDLGLSAEDSADIGEDVAADSALDGLDLGNDGLESISDVADLPDDLTGLEVDDKSLADASLEFDTELTDAVAADENIGSITDELEALGGEVEEEISLDLDAELSDSLEDGLLGEVDELVAGESDAQIADLELPGEETAILEEVSELSDEAEAAVDAALSLADDDENLDATENSFDEVDLDSFSSEASKSWDVEAAQSVFDSRDVEGESDGLLDSARKESAEDNSIDLELPLAAEAEVSGSESEAVEQDSVVSDEVSEIDPLADITNLGEMDFSQMSDDDNGNDDIFDNSGDMVGTKLDLAKAYIDMGDQDGARSILDEVVDEGDDEQRHEAEELKQQIS